MTRIRTHNNRARRLPYAVFARRVSKARKVARLAMMYGAGPRKLREAIQNHEFYRNHEAELLDEYRKACPHVQQFVREFFEQEPGPFHGTASGMVARGPSPQYQISKTVSHDQYTAQLNKAHRLHVAAVNQAMADGNTVIEHTEADATIIPQSKKPST